MDEIDLKTVIYHDGYSNGYDDGIKAGKVEILNELMKTITELKTSSEVVSCSTLIQMIQSRKDIIEYK